MALDSIHKSKGPGFQPIISGLNDAEILALRTALKIDGVPVGSVIFSPTGTVFPGYLELNGSTFSSTTYPELYAALGTTTLPDFRDRVARHAGTNAGSSGATQEDAFQGHRHSGGGAADYQSPGSGPTPFRLAWSTDGSNTTQVVNADPSYGTPRIASETRVKAYIGKYLIKAAAVPINSGTVDYLSLATDVVGKVNKADIVGTLISSGNGRIIEKGSNANGEYTKFADGTLHCWKRHTLSHSGWTGHGVLFYSTAFSWTYPATFITPPMISGIGRADGSLTYLASAGGTENGTTADLHAVSAFNAGVTNAYYRMMAVGRWF